MKIAFLFLAVCAVSISLNAQLPHSTYWTKDGNGYYALENNEIVLYQLPALTKKTIVSQKQLTPSGADKSLAVKRFFFSDDFKKLLIYTNAKKVWRYETKGDYWVLNVENNNLQKLGKDKPASSLMFAKFSPDGNNIAYVSNYNIYVENLATQKITPITTNGNRQLINGTFDWAYEEEFFCRDGFRWSPDGKRIAYWQITANNTKDYIMLNTTDSIYPKVIPVEYPVAGEKPSSFKIGVADITTAKTKWMSVPTDSVWGSYVPRMEWAANNSQLIIQHLNRKQNVSDIMLCDVASGNSKTIYYETDEAWIDILPLWDDDYTYGSWDWLNKGKEFVWASEKDGWRHLYRISADGKSETLITKGNYDVMRIELIDEKNNYVYFDASPENATQKYLYRTKLDGTGSLERLSPLNQRGTHEYHLSPNAAFAEHGFSNYFTPNVSEWVSLPGHEALNGHKVYKAVESADSTKSNIQFFTVKTSEGIEMDGWIVKPNNFDPNKKYPVVFYVYTEPWGQMVKDEFGAGYNYLYKGDMANDGYVYISIDNRGTPVPKGRAWRKSVHKKIGLVNIKDQAMAAKEILKWNFIDTSRVAVWGWSGGGSATLNLMFQYPEIYKTGIAVAAVGNQLTYDNIYQERYMGLPQENKQDFVNGSPITYAKNLKGNLLYIHGTGDDNVHYSNAEMLINELIKYNKQFQLMSYPNRTHSISEGAGTFNHLSTLYTNYLKQYCPPGAK
ncbi:MAG: S9 family peptidase [Sphingobacteriia bacterium]|nr:S9 family peptidase [Sphingobacteriia bacterium]